MYSVYILASKKDGVLYIGVTNNLSRRIREHKSGITEGFTKKYHVKHLVYVETYSLPTEAIEREKQLKKWRREKKVALIEQENPGWDNLVIE